MSSERSDWELSIRKVARSVQVREQSKGFYDAVFLIVESREIFEKWFSEVVQIAGGEENIQRIDYSNHTPEHWGGGNHLLFHYELVSRFEMGRQETIDLEKNVAEGRSKEILKGILKRNKNMPSPVAVIIENAGLMAEDSTAGQVNYVRDFIAETVKVPVFFVLKSQEEFLALNEEMRDTISCSSGALYLKKRN